MQILKTHHGGPARRCCRQQPTQCGGELLAEHFDIVVTIDLHAEQLVDDRQRIHVTGHQPIDE